MLHRELQTICFALPRLDISKLITRCIAAPTDSEVASFICRCCRCVLFCNVGYMAYIISRLSALSACLLHSGALVEILVLHFSWKWARTTVIRLVLRKCGWAFDRVCIHHTDQYKLRLTACIMLVRTTPKYMCMYLSMCVAVYACKYVWEYLA